jgi:pimeloyl-ACP methyl ester carboxylesterase
MKTPIASLLIIAHFIVNYCAAQAPADPSPKQVKFFFPGAALADNYVFNFFAKFSEIYLKGADSTQLHALLFKADSSKGVILYLKGNTGSVAQWGGAANVYTNLHYDLLMPDYRGYGKSHGTIKNEAQLYSDMQQAYNYLKRSYAENKIIVLGYSIGTGPAAYLAANNHPRLLILQAPYYSLPDAMYHLRPGFDTVNIAFHFNTWQYLKQTTAPIVIFHGDQDKMFYYGSSLKLQANFKPGDKLITLKGAGHPYMDRNVEYLDSLKSVLR